MKKINVPNKSSNRMKFCQSDMYAIEGTDLMYDPGTMDLFESNQSLTSAGVDHNFPYMNPPQASLLVLQTCYACNLACKYCFVEEKMGGEMMSLEMAQKAVHMIKGSPSRGSNVGFFGGEPFMNWKMVKEFMPWYASICEHHRPKFSFTTNGCLITEDICLFLRDYDVSFVFSLDGPEVIHDALRIKKDGSGSHYDALMGLGQIHKNLPSASVTLRATYSPDMIDTLYDRMIYLNEMKYSGLAQGVSIEPAFLTESNCASRDQLDYSVDAVTPEIRAEYLRCLDWLVNEVEVGRKPSFFHITKMIERLFYRVAAPSECGAGKGYFSADASGVIYACHRTAMTTIGHVENAGVDESLRAKWLDNRYYSRTGCSECPIRNLCGGGCREESLCQFNDIAKPVQMSCDFKKLFVDLAAIAIQRLGPELIQGWVRDPRRTKKKERKSCDC